ncbi:hypothetical protein ElyMa_001820800 [Elysia marginata]|uniref:DDE Tnp4 domain-containing protein n=1 Tax=Elysia marginata TaxID=1093978 RepID=A0AAV4EI23_9GAST|nr:hypothetical protein ElyMa_001820800 [Elysia marginata]
MATLGQRQQACMSSVGPDRFKSLVYDIRIRSVRIAFQVCFHELKFSNLNRRSSENIPEKHPITGKVLLSLALHHKPMPQHVQGMHGNYKKKARFNSYIKDL